MSLSLTFDYTRPPFAAASREAMENSILAFCEGKGSSITISEVSETQVRVELSDKDAERVQALLEKAADYCNQGKFEGAKSSIYKLLKAWPFHSEAYRLLAQVLFGKGDLDKAVDTNLDALRFDPRNVWALILMGNIFAAKEKPEVADTYYNKVLEYHPDNALALNNLGGVYCKRKDYARGVDFFLRALAIQPSYVSAHYGLALARLNQGRDEEAFEAALRGLAEGVERPEDEPLRPHLLQLAADAAGRVEESTDLLPAVTEVARGIEKKYGTAVRFVEDDSLKVLAHMEFADQHGRDFHVVRYRRSGHYAHLVLHELMHLVMMQEAKEAGRLKTIGFVQENFDLFLERHRRVFDLVRRSMDTVTADGLADQLFRGLSVQVMSVPLDLFVEMKIYDEYPAFRAAQFASLYAMEQNNLKSVEAASAVEYFPQEAKDVNKLLNMLSSLLFRTLFGASLFDDYSATSHCREKARDMYARFEAVRASFRPGDEYTLFEEYAQQENVLDYFHVTGGGPASPDAGFRTAVERNQEAFNKVHKKKDPVVDAMMSEYMLGALRAFEAMSPESVAAVARECALKGMNGIQPGTDARYSLNAFPGKSFSGYEFLAYYYVSWAQAMPDMLLDTGLPFHSAYAQARRMFEDGR